METSTVSHFLFLLGRTSAEACILVVLVLATSWLFRRQLAPHWRCALWLLVAARLLLPLSFSSATSVFNLLPRTAHMEPVGLTPMPAVAMAAADRHVPYGPLVTPNEPGAVREPIKANRTAFAAGPSIVESGFKWSWPICVFVIWLTGVLVLVRHIAVSSFRLWRRSTPLSPTCQMRVMPLLQECCKRLQLRNPPKVFENTGASSPALYGLLRPRLLLPKGFTEQFSPTEMRFVFLHELAHLKRRDLLMNWLVVALQVMHWFNPLVWFAFSRWRAERELACDAMALEAAGEGQNKEYGRTILRLLDRFSRPMATPGLVGVLEDKRQLRQRIGMIASFVPRQGWPRLAIILIGILAAIGLTDARTGATSVANPAGTPSLQSSVPAVSKPVISPASAAPSITISSSLPSNTALHVDPQPVIISTTTTPPEKGNEMNTSKITNQVVRAAAVGLLALASPTTPTVLHAEDNLNAPNSATSATSEPANQLIGAWILVGTPGHVGKAPASGGRIKFFTGTHWCITQADPKTGVVLFHHGGTYTVNGDKLHSNLEFANSSTVKMIGKTNGNYMFTINGDTLTSLGIDNPWQEVWQRQKAPDSMSSPHGQSLTGTWAYAGKPGESDAASPDNHRLKFCAGGCWCDSEIDPKTGVVTVHHGGTCALDGDTYVETCRYGNPTSVNLIGEDMKFKITIEGDTLTLKGIENPFNEVWKRVN